MPPVDVMRPEPDPRNQQPLDMDFAVLIVPEAIPIPGTSVEVLQTTVASMRTAAGEVCEDGEGIESSWQGLQAHYSAPESETLFAAMGPVASKGETILDETTTVADALDTFAEAAQTAQTRLRSLKEDATAFAEEMRDEEDWSGDMENYAHNRYLILEVNRAWGEFQEAERTCANAIAAVSGSGNTYVAVSEGEPGAGEIAYGLDPGDVPEVAYDLTSLADWKRLWEDSWHHLEFSEKPWPLDWAADAFVAQWDNFGPGMLWDVGVGVVSATGLWSQRGGWATSVGEAADNFVTHKEEAIQGFGALAGLHGEDGWMNPFDAGERSGETWRANAGEAWTEVAHDLVPWREWEDRPAYTVYTGAGNAALTVVSLPVRGGSILANLGRGGSDLPELDLHERPEIAWEPGAAARPGFSLAETVSGIRGDFTETTDGFGAGLGDLSGMIDGWSEQSPSPVGPGTGSEVPRSVPVAADAPDGIDGTGAPRGGDEPVVAAGQPDPPRRGDEDRSVSEPGDLDAPSTERWPEAEEFLAQAARRDGEGDSTGSEPDSDGEGASRPQEAASDGAPSTVVGDGVHTTLDSDPRTIEREYERELELETQRVHEMAEEFLRRSPEEQAAWLRSSQLVGANAMGGSPDSGFGDRGDDGFGITASHEANTGNGGGPPITPPDGNGGPRGGTGILESTGEGGTRGSGGGSFDGSRWAGSPLLPGSDGGRENSGDSDGSTGNGQGDGVDDLPNTAEELRNHRWGEGEANKKRFYEHFERLVNDQSNGIFKEFYKKNGHRLSRFIKVGLDEFTLPKLTRLGEDKPWIVRETLPTPDEPTYKGDDRDYLFRRDLENSPVNDLDRLAEKRADAIELDKRATQRLATLEEQYKEHLASGGEVPDDLAAARNSYSTAHDRMIRAAENYGEGVAEVAVREQFDGSPVLDENGKPKLDDDGNVIHKPKVVGQIPMPDTVPRNGNHQFDQIWATEDGGIVIVEAKSSQKTPLGDRLVEGDDGKPKRVSQGTIEYFEDILEKMRERGENDSRNGFTEERLAEIIEGALDNGKLHYVEVKGDPVTHTTEGGVTAHRSGGYSFREFNIEEEG